MVKAKPKARKTTAHSRQGREPLSKGDEKLALLQRTMLSLIAREGASGATHRKVASEAGVSLSATTYYFKSKQDMVRSTFQYLCAELHASINSLVTTFGGEREGTSERADEIKAAGQFVKSQLQADAEEGLTFVELMLHLARDSDARDLVADDRKAVREFVVALMKRSHSLSPDEDADLFMALVTGLLLESLARGRPANFEARAISIGERVMEWLTENRPAPKRRKRQ